MAEKFKPTREAQVIALRSIEATPAPPSVIPGAKEEWRYELTDGRFWYVKANHIAKVEKLGVGPLVPFRVFLREYAPGKTVLDVLPLPQSSEQPAARPASPSPAAPPAAAPPAHPTPTSVRMVTPIRGGAAKAMGQLATALVEELPSPTDADDPRFARPATNGHANGNGNGNGHTTNGNGHATVAIPVNGNGESLQDIAMKAAIDVCLRGQKYAEAKGMHILFDADMVCRIMNTIQIGMNDRAKGRSY